MRWSGSWGVWFPRGGTGALVAAWCACSSDLGGDDPAQCAACDEIVVDRAARQRSRAADGRAVPGLTRRPATPTSCTPTTSSCAAHARRRDEARQPAEEALQHVAVRRLFRPAGGSPTSAASPHVLFGPRYRELIDDIFHGDDAGRRFLALPACALRRPTRRWRRPGAARYYVLAPVPHLGNADIDWDVEGPRYRDRILDYLEQRYIPGPARATSSPAASSRRSISATSSTPISARPSRWSRC